MRYLLCHAISQKPPVGYVHFDLFYRLTYGADPKDVFYQDDFEQHDRIYAWPSVILAIKPFDFLIDELKADRLIYVSLDMSLRYHFLQTYHLHLITHLLLFFR